MANTKIADFPLASALTLTDLIMIDDGTTISKSATQQQGIDLINVSGLLETGSLLDGAITFPKIQDISTNSFLGRDTGGTGPVEELSAANARNVLNVENGADVTDEANVISSLDGASIPSVTVAGGDKVILQDISNSDNLKVVTAQSIADLSPNGTVTSIASGTGLLGGPITISGTLSVDVGTTANKIVQLDGSAKLPPVDGSQLTNLPAAGGGLLAANNLSDVANVATSRSNLSVPSNAEALLGSNNLSDVNNASTSRSNLNVPSNSEALLGSNNLSDVDSLSTARSNLNVENGADVTDEANVKSALDGASISNVTVSGSDKVLIQDVSNSDNLRTVTAQSVADLSAPSFAGAMLRLDAAVATANGTALILDWSQFFENGDFFNVATPKRLTVPSGVTRIRLFAGARWTSNSTGIRELSISINTETTSQSNLPGLGMASQNAVNGIETEQNLASGVISVSSGDFFVVRVLQNSGGNLDVSSFNSGTYFGIEAIG